MTLGRCPLVLFETYYDAAGRGLLFDMLTREEYRIFGLPWSPRWRVGGASSREFSQRSLGRLHRDAPWLSLSAGGLIACMRH